MSFKLYREIQNGEWLIAGADCSQGGSDRNWCSFFSPSKMDFPLEYYKRGVAATMTDDVFPVLEWIHDTTGLPPIVAFEQNNGGGSEMARLEALNRMNKYKIYRMRVYGNADNSKVTDKLGFATTSATRPILLGEWKKAFDNHLVKIYDEKSIDEHYTFIISKSGRPDHEKDGHDDSIFAKAICWQLYQTEQPPRPASYYENNKPIYTPRDDVIGI